MKHFSLILKPILFSFVFLFSTTNCYFNPLVNGVLNPKVEEADSSALLGLAGGQVVTVSITGQIRRSGVALANTEISLGKPSFSAKKSATSTTTNTAGWFNLDIPAGPATLQFSDAGTPVTITLMVSPITATVISVNNSTYQIQNLEVYVSGEEPPVYLELISSMPYDGFLIDGSNYGILIGGSFKFKFSEVVAQPSEPSTWLAENFIMNPPLTFESPMISKEDVTIMLSGSLLEYTPYTITLKSGIKSTTGKTIRPTTIQFRVGQYL